MDKEGEIQSNVYTEQFSQVRFFVHYITYYKNLTSCTYPFEGDFFDSACYSFLGVATLAWCNVFADCKSHVYWSKLIKNMPEEVEQDFKKRICKSTGLSEEKYQKYQCEIRSLRDKCFAHLDLDWRTNVPYNLSFCNALEIAKQYECWVKELLCKEGTSTPDGISFDDTITGAKNDVEHIVKFLKTQKK